MYKTLVLLGERPALQREIDELSTFDVETQGRYLLKLKYIVSFPMDRPDQPMVYYVSEEGWKFIDEYEKNVERRKTNKYLLFLTVPAALYYIFGLIQTMCHFSPITKNVMLDILQLLHLR